MDKKRIYIVYPDAAKRNFYNPAFLRKIMQPPIGSLHPLIAAVVLAVLAIASFTDVRTREVPDWLNYGLTLFGLGAGVLLSLAFWTWTYVAYSVLGMLAFLGIAMLMFYAGQWGGGDSKLLIGLGAAMGLPFSLHLPFFDLNSVFVSFWLNLLLAAVIYATLWTAFLAVKHRRKVLVELRAGLSSRAKTRRIVLFLAILVLALSFASSERVIKLLLATASVLVTLLLYLPAFMKAVERASMLRFVRPQKLTEGDWIAEDVIVEKKRIVGPSDLGVTSEQIKKLEALHSLGKIKKVLIKVGIPFVPSFLLAFIATLLYGNVLGKIIEILSF